MLLYQVMSEWVNQLSLECRVRRVLKDFALGMIVSGSCQLEAVASALAPRGRVESQYRRLQRFLANERVKMAVLQAEWAAMVVKTMQAEQVVLLVDETALSDHLKAMVLGYGAWAVVCRWHGVAIPHRLIQSRGRCNSS